DQFRIQTLDDWRAGRTSAARRFDSRYAPRTPFSVDRFLAMVNDALRICPPPARHASLMAQFTPLGIGATAPSDITQEARAALEQACTQAQQLLDSPEQQVFGAPAEAD